MFFSRAQFVHREFLINTTLITYQNFFSLFFIFINLKICEADNENEVCNLLLATIKCFGGWLLPDVSFECWHCIFYFLLLTLLFYFGPAKCKPLLWFLSFSLSSYLFSMLLYFQECAKKGIFTKQKALEHLETKVWCCFVFSAIYFIIAASELFLGLHWREILQNCMAISFLTQIHLNLLCTANLICHLCKNK